MSNLSGSILDLIRKSPGLTDREITDRLRGTTAPQQPINQAARHLEGKGLLHRRRRQDQVIGNYPAEGDPAPVSTKPTRTTKIHDVDALSEDKVKGVLETWLKAQGWDTKIAWGNAQGIDIDAHLGPERWIIEVKGPGSRQPMRVNYFIGILGETLQRMSDSEARYSIAFPDLPQYRGLWDRLPHLAKKRTGISLLLVTEAGTVEHLEE
ncbi:MAG: MarR family transcriptional regulator [Deltaproteobacteria bacterium]|nr:MarR family transcriptional regulator [Deltaproteobacteria bacterium]